MLVVRVARDPERPEILDTAVLSIPERVQISVVIPSIVPESASCARRFVK
jgi:hypothetical protein